MAFLRPAQIVIRDARGTSEDLARGEVAYLAMLDAYSKFMPRIDVAQLSAKKYEASWSEGAKERILVAELQGMIVGVADVMRLHDGWFLIEPMHVRPGYQRQGIGTRLFEKCEETAALDQAPGLRVYSLRDNENANRFYRKMKFEQVAADEWLKVGSNRYATLFEKRLHHS